MSGRLDRRRFLAGTGAALAAGAFLPGGILARAPSREEEEEDRELRLQATVDLEFWNPANDPLGEHVINGLVKGFNRTTGKKHGIHVTSRLKPIPDSGTYVQYTTAMSSSGSPDVVMTYAYNPVAGWAADGFIRPLDKYARSLGIKESEFYPPAWKMISFGGHIWGLLQEFDMNKLYYNKNIHSGAPPRTIADLDAMSKEYTKFDSSGKLVQVGLIPWDQGNGTDWNTMFGGSFYDSKNLKWTIDKHDNLAFLDWFQTYVKLFGGRAKSDSLDSTVNTNISNTDIFTEGKSAFELEGEWDLADWKQMQLKLDYGVGHTPTTNGVPYGTGVTIGGNVFVLPTKSPHPEQAATFITYMGSQTGVRSWCDPTGNLPPVKAVGASEKFQQSFPDISLWVTTLEKFPVTPPVPSPQFTLFQTLIGTAMDSVTYGKKTPKEALSGVATQIKQQVQKFHQENPKWEGE